MSACGHEDYCGCGPEIVELIPGENCCPDCGDPDCYGGCALEAEYETEYEDDYLEDDMDGDFDSAMASAGHGTDEDYGYYGDDNEDDW